MQRLSDADADAGQCVDARAPTTETWKKHRTHYDGCGNMKPLASRVRVSSRMPCPLCARLGRPLGVNRRIRPAAGELCFNSTKRSSGRLSTPAMTNTARVHRTSTSRSFRDRLGPQRRRMMCANAPHPNELSHTCCTNNTSYIEKLCGK